MAQTQHLRGRLLKKDWERYDRARLRQAAIETWKREPSLGLAKICWLLGINRSSFWRWRRRYDEHGLAGLLRDRPTAKLRRITPEIEQKIIDLRREHGWGHQRIQLYLQRYLGQKVSSSTVWNILKRHNMPNLYMTRYNTRSKRPFRRYQKELPGDTIQMDVKFVKDPERPGRRLYQFTAIDDCTRYRVLRIYARNTTRSAMEFLEQVRKVFPAAIKEIQTDNGPEFATEFTFQLDQDGIRHRRIRPRTPRLNGKVERSIRTDVQEFYTKQKFADINDLQEKLARWERQYNHERAHMALDGQTPAERLQSKMSTDSIRRDVADEAD